MVPAESAAGARAVAAIGPHSPGSLQTKPSPAGFLESWRGHALVGLVPRLVRKLFDEKPRCADRRHDCGPSCRRIPPAYALQLPNYGVEIVGNIDRGRTEPKYRSRYR
jgi:hypothetical protein